MNEPPRGGAVSGECTKGGVITHLPFHSNSCSHFLPVLDSTSDLLRGVGRFPQF